MDKGTFIAETAAQILASSYANNKADPRSAQEAITLSIELWDELVSRNIVTSSDEEDRTE